MIEYEIPYGKTIQRITLSEDWKVSIVKPNSRKALNGPSAAMTDALESLNYDHGNSVKTAAITINDKTRPVPHGLMLPPLLSWLEDIGYQRKNIVLIIATGTHTPMTTDEHHLIVPDEIDQNYRIISHDAFDEESLVFRGTTSSGTPCYVNRIYAEADLRIVIGNIEPHQYMGWSGGSKSAAIGLGGAETIRVNHSMLSREGAGPCSYTDNPVRQDVEEMGRLIGVHLALNVVMNDNKEIVAVFAGEPRSVMENGIAVAGTLFTTPVSGEADLVISSAGGYPKDINLYQAQKALRHATAAAAPGAPMILVGECPEGIGSPAYESWMHGKMSQEQVREAFHREEFRLGPHKAMLIAEDAMDRDVYLVSGLPKETVEKLLFNYSESVQAAVDLVSESLVSRSVGRSVRVAILPYGNATVPIPE